MEQDKDQGAEPTEVTPSAPLDGGSPGAAAEPSDPAAPAAPVSRRDAIAAALEKREKEGAASASPSQPAIERPRDPATGRFINKDGSLAAPDAGAAAAAQAPQAPAALARKPMPKAWKQDYAPKWDALPTDIADFLAEQEAARERQVMEGVEKYRGLSQYAEGLRDVISPHEQALTQQYGSVAAGVKQLFAISNAAAQNPLEFIQWFAQQRGIDLASLAPQAPQGQQQQPGTQPDPNAAPQGQPDLTPFVQRAIQPYLQKMTGLERQVQQFTEAQRQAAQAQSVQAVNGFFSEKDEQGNLKYQLDDGAMDEFSKRVMFHRSNHQDWDDRRVLEAAYKEVTRLQDDFVEKEIARREKERKEREARELAAKRAAAVQVKGAPATSPAAPIDPRNRRAIIERALGDLQR